MSECRGVGAGDGGWSWHLVEAELRARGHRTVAPDLPDHDAATLTDYANVVAAAVGKHDGEPLVVVGQSFGGIYRAAGGRSAVGGSHRQCDGPGVG